MTEACELTVYPLRCGERLGANWVPLHFRRVRDSRWRAVVEPEARAYGVDLWYAACDQDPAGTPPLEDPELAMLAGLGRDVATWERVRDGAGGARLGPACAAGVDEPQGALRTRGAATELALAATSVFRLNGTVPLMVERGLWRLAFHGARWTGWPACSRSLRPAPSSAPRTNLPAGLRPLPAWSRRRSSLRSRPEPRTDRSAPRPPQASLS